MVIMILAISVKNVTLVTIYLAVCGYSPMTVTTSISNSTGVS